MPLSATQMKYLALTWQCFETEPKIDYEKFARVAGLASAASARELLRVTKKKLKEEYSGGGEGDVNGAGGDGGATATPKGKGKGGGKASSVGKKSTGAKRGRSGTAQEEDEGEDRVEGDKEKGEEPKKRGKKIKREVRSELEEEEEFGEMI